MKLNEAKEKIREIKNSDFILQEIGCCGENYLVSILMRRALLLLNQIGDIENINDEEIIELCKKLDEVMKDKLKELNPNFNEETLANMIASYKRSNIIYPMNIFVIDDAVLHKEGVFDDWGYDIYETQTFMYEMKENKYFDISRNCFNFDDDLNHGKKKRLTNEDNMYVSKFISDNINSIYNENITQPVYELDNFIKKGISYIGIDDVIVYINMKFDDIGRSLLAKEEIDLKICIQNGDDMILYYIHQSFEDDKPVWNVVKVNDEVWIFTEEVQKLEKNNNTRKLEK